MKISAAIIAVVAAAAAWSARETYRVRMNDLGNPDAVPVDQANYERLRNESIVASRS